MKILRRLVAVGVAALAAWFGLYTTAAAGVEPSPAPVAIGDHDSLHHGSILVSAIAERGPPARTNCVTACEAVDRWSHGAGARPDATVSEATTTYTTPAELVQVALVTGTTQTRVHGTQGDLSALPRSDVAANSGSRIAANQAAGNAARDAISAAQ